MLGEDRIRLRDERQDIGAEDRLPGLAWVGLVAGGQIQWGGPAGSTR